MTTLRDNFGNRTAAVDFKPLSARNFEPVGVEAQQLEHGRVNVGDVVPVRGGVEAQLVGGAVNDAPFDSASGHHDRKSIGMMVAAVGPLCTGSSSEFGSQDDDRLIEQAALLEIFDQPGDRQIDLPAQRRVPGLEGAVRVPGAGPSVRSVKNLYEPRSPFDQPPGDEALASKRFGCLVVQAIHLLDGRGFSGAIDDLGHGRLHVEGQLVGLDARAAQTGSRRDIRRPATGWLSRSSRAKFFALLLSVHVAARPGKGQRIFHVSRELHAGVLGAQVICAMRTDSAAAVVAIGVPITANCGRLSLSVPSP